jgi:CheY-like chemotaxis protein
LGIAREALPHLFERYWQGANTQRRSHGQGLGLGLAIARQLAELHGGTIVASSEGLGQGATFTVRLPLMIVHPVPSELGVRRQPRVDREPPVATDMPRLDGVRVLAVDDEPDSLELLKTVLEGAGATVRTSSSAAAALQILHTSPTDVIVADIGMPQMDGLQLIRAVRQMAGAVASTPAAALTAYARSQDRITSVASGYQMHLVKPIDPIELIVAVAALAGRRMGA